ncbi:hypothetical protein [Methylobacterium sp. CCH5-D2]|uniref:hypothetical protein n=1 Tax=Methylobacterium sp. CCH5-D2 TaxID=1768765 RepID=UPI00082D8D06|nr:hypothetical protein [Methylobacterium sp. CCH5-D2]
MSSLADRSRARRRPPSRAEVETMIETLIAYLDVLDGDPDLETEEPEAGAREWCGSGAHRFDVGAES